MAAGVDGCARGSATVADSARTEGERIFRPPPEPIVPSGIAGAPAPDAPDWPSTLLAQSVPVATIPPSTVASVPVNAEAKAEPPRVDERHARPAAQGVLVDAKVGDVSGKAIFVSEFFEPIAARLTAEGRGMNRETWIARVARPAVRDRLAGILQDELFIEEARSRMTPEKRQGLLYFLSKAGEEARSSALGSPELAREKLLTEQGMTEQEYLRRREQNLLIRDILLPVLLRVHISSADIERYYTQNRDTFVPPATAHYRMIVVRKADAAAVERVSTALAAGEPFERVASTDANRYKAAEGGRMEPTRFTGEYATAELLRLGPLNDAARTLTPGAWAGPIDMTDNEWAWLALDRVERTALSLYESQIAIDRALRKRFEDEEVTKYFLRLRGPVDPRADHDIVQDLVDIAVERYGPPPGRVGAP